MENQEAGTKASSLFLKWGGGVMEEEYGEEGRMCVKKKEEWTFPKDIRAEVSPSNEELIQINATKVCSGI